MAARGKGAARAAGEFELIDTLFRPLAATTPAALGLGDDAAVFTPPPGRDLVFTKDAMVEGVHFLTSDDPADIAKKLLRVNLSDLAAMGASPCGYLLATFWPEQIGEDWIARFAAGLAEDQQRFGIGLFGGDTVRTPGPLSLSLTAIGEVATGQALRRNGAREGDLLVVSGSIGDAALGLQVLKGTLTDLGEVESVYLTLRYHAPTPRLALAPHLPGIATSCIDISDGLVADVGHIATESGLAAEISWPAVPLSDAARAALARDESLRAVLLTGGDDYELAFTLAPERAEALKLISAAANVPLAVIGKMTRGQGVTVRDGDGSELTFASGGWRHF